MSTETIEMPLPSLGVFKNLASDEDIAHWLEASLKECKSTYPMLQQSLSVAIDIGANVGGFCVYANQNFKKIYAFEPEQRNYFILSNVIKQFNLTNVAAFNTAVYGQSSQTLALKKHAGSHSRDVSCATFGNIE